MKRFILLIATVATTFFVNAQDNIDLAIFAGTVASDRMDNLADYFYYSGTATSDNINLTNVPAGDTIMLFYTVGEINDPSIQGSSVGHDTLTLDLAFVPWAGTSNAAYTISYNRGSFSYSNISGITEGNYDTYKFLEGETDTIMVIINSGTVYFDRFDVNSTSDNVVTNTEQGLSSSNTLITNPVEEGVLSIYLEGQATSLELLNLSGNVVKQFEVNGSASIGVHELVSGLYILRDTNSNSFKKIMIK